MVDTTNIVSRKIGFTDAMIWIATLIGYVIVFTGYGTNASDWNGPILIYKLGAIPCLSIVLALLTRNYKMWKPVLANVWQIAISTVPLSEKQLLIQKNLEKIVDRWYSFWIQFQKIVLSKDPFEKKFDRLKLLFKEIYTGEINIFQMIWIILYLIYSLVVASNLFNVPIPIDFIINISFFTVLLYSKGNVAGIAQLLYQIFLCLAPAKSETELKANMDRLVDELKENNEIYYYIDLQKKRKFRHTNPISRSHRKENCLRPSRFIRIT